MIQSSPRMHINNKKPPDDGPYCLFSPSFPFLPFIAAY